MAVDWGTATCVGVNPDGSFSAQLQAGPGNTIYVAAVGQDSCSGQWILANAAAVLRVPEGVIYTAPAQPFTISGYNNAWHWIAAGEMSGAAPFVQFTLPDGQHQGCIVPRIHIYRLFDMQGQYVTQTNVNVFGPVLTPTGLPIETDFGPQDYWALFKPSVAGKPLTEQCLNANARYDLTGWNAGLDPGWYRTRIVFYTVQPDGSESHDTGAFQGLDQSPLNGEVEKNTGIAYLPLVNVGNAASPRIPATLLNGAPSWGSAGALGVVANEDQGRFALGSRRSLQGPYIASPHDPLSGRVTQYLLEPYLPTLGYSGFGFLPPQIPQIPLDDSALGNLSVSLTRPDGSSAALASNAPLTQSFIAGSTAISYPVPLSFAGPARTYGVTTGKSELVATFDQYGKYTVALSGSLKTLWGQRLDIKGTYDIWVAEPLDLKLGTLEGTPLEVGDTYSPVVIIQPEVPATVTVNIDEYINGDPAQKQSYTNSGKANQYGYFVADKTWKAPAPGEYIARITAAYTDPADGKLWMATRTGASIVATPGSTITGHGERNTALANITGDKTLRTWFFTKTFDPNCGEAACDSIGNHHARTVGCYPFFRGDVAWLADMSPIVPCMSLEDPQNVLATLAPQVAANSNNCDATFCVDTPDEKRLVSKTSAGRGAQQRPGAVTSWAYWYESSVRADGIHVDAKALEDTAAHKHWYGHDGYNCQIGLPCYDAWTNFTLGDRNGDEEGDVKLLFGGAVIKSPLGSQFIPYASMAVITHGAVQTSPQDPKTFTFPDPKGNRVCPPYQGATGGLATCGPLLTIQNQPYDLFVTPTGTRPGQVLQTGDTFVFSGQAWPTLDVAVAITVTTPSGQVKSFTGRATRSGYIDSAGKTFQVAEPGTYGVHVSLTQDRVVPSTGLAPNPAIVADGKTMLTAYGYKTPLSALLGTLDSTYHFTVAESRSILPVTTQITLANIDTFAFAKTPSHATLKFTLPANSDSLRYTVTIPGLVIRDQAVSGSPDQLTVDLDAKELYSQGFTNVVLGADSIEIVITGRSNGSWFARTLNLRSSTPFGGSPPTVQ